MIYRHFILPVSSFHSISDVDMLIVDMLIVDMLIVDMKKKVYTPLDTIPHIIFRGEGTSKEQWRILQKYRLGIKPPTHNILGMP